MIRILCFSIMYLTLAACTRGRLQMKLAVNHAFGLWGRIRLEGAAPVSLAPVSESRLNFSLSLKF